MQWMMHRLTLFAADAAATVMAIWAAYGLRRAATAHSTVPVRTAATILSLIMLTTGGALFAALIVSTGSPPPREVDDSSMVMLFVGLVAAICGGFLAASSLEEVRDSLWPSAVALLPAFVMLLPYKLQPQEYGRRLRLPLVALVALALGFVAWSVYRWWRRSPPHISVSGRKIMTRVSLGTLWFSIVLLTIVLVHPSAFVGLGDEDLPKILVFVLGLLSALLGGFMGASAVEHSRDRLWPTGALLLVLWVTLMSDFEPGSW